MRFFIVGVSAICLTIAIILSGFAQEAKEKSSQAQTREAIGRIVSVDPKNSSFDLQYEAGEQTHNMQISTFYVTDITTIDIATVKSSLNDLKPGFSVLLEYAQMPDGTKVVESVWVKKS